MTNNTSNSYHEAKTWIYSKIKFMAWLYKKTPNYIVYLQPFLPAASKFVSLKYAFQHDRKIYDF